MVLFALGCVWWMPLASALLVASAPPSLITALLLAYFMDWRLWPWMEILGRVARFYWQCAVRGELAAVRPRLIRAQERARPIVQPRSLDGGHGWAWQVEPVDDPIRSERLLSAYVVWMWFRCC